MRDIFKKIVTKIVSAQARAVVRKYKPHIVAITGSVGKTSTKDAIFSVVSQGAYARKSEKSFNSEIGIPLTILGLPNAWGNPLRWIQNILEGFFVMLIPTHYPQWLVLEVGADRPGDIQSVAKWLRSDVVVITRVPDVPVHVEFFDSMEEVVEEKAALITSLKKGGTLVLYGDDEKTRALASRAPQDVKHMYFGFLPQNDVEAERVTVRRSEGDQNFPSGLEAMLSFGEEAVPVFVPSTIGEHALLPLIAAAAVGKALGKSPTAIAEALKSYTPPLGRMHLLRGVKDSLIIDDTYNASPAASLAALEALAAVGANNRKIAVLGDMTELGRYSMDEHRKLGVSVAAHANMLVTVGFRAKGIAEGALRAGLSAENILQFQDSSRAGDALDDILMPGDIVLCKGSQAMRMEKVVENIMAEPERASELLVRQDVEWRRR